MPVLQNCAALDSDDWLHTCRSAATGPCPVFQSHSCGGPIPIARGRLRIDRVGDDDPKQIADWPALFSGPALDLGPSLRIKTNTCRVKILHREPLSCATMREVRDRSQRIAEEAGAPPRTKCLPQAQNEERGCHGLLGAIRVTPASWGAGGQLFIAATTTATMGVLFAGGTGPAVRCRTAPPSRPARF
jgi:hypothetical protein